MIHRKKGFTLIELLVVIAIIGLLMSIVLPALRKVKIQAKMTICGSNQRQLVYGLLTYAENNDGAFPYHPTMDNEANGGKGEMGHRPFELNWNHNNMDLVSDPESRSSNDYPYVGRFMYPYLESADVWNCPVSGIKDSTPWPPETSGLESEGTYGGFYRTGGYASLHSTYTLLWRYRNPGDLSAGFAEFEGPRKLGISSASTLLVQDSLFYMTTFSNILWTNPENSWYSSHWFKGAENTKPYFTIKDTDASASNFAAPDNIKMNAGYMDGHVDRFNSGDTKLLRNIYVRLRVTQKYR